MFVTTTQPERDLSRSYAEGDTFVYPCGTRCWLVQEVFDDGAYGGSVFAPAQPDLTLSWIELTGGEIAEQRLRLYAGPTLGMTGRTH